MKKLFALLFSVLFIVGSAQTDTAQVVVPNRKNSVEALAKPYVILISADGFRYDYAKKYKAENILNYAKIGVAAKAMIPSFPSITFPNHWSLITGLYPAHHGLIDNYFYDYKKQKFYAMSSKENAEDGSWYGGIPLWSLAEKEGVLSASMMWVGSASDAGGMRSSYYYHYHEKFSPNEKVDKVINWLKLPEENRPHFISLYFPEVDAAGHRFGPDSPETEKAVHLIDDALKKLVEKVKELGLKNINFIFVADHGMIKVDTEKPLEIPEILFDKKRFDFYNSQTLLRVEVKDPGEVKAVYRALKKNKTNNYDVYLDKRFPRKLNFGQRDDRYNRIGQILIVPKPSKIFLEKGKKTSSGKHGYNPYEVPEMKAVFVAFGPAFKKDKEIGEFQNVNVYPIVTDILGLKITEPIDGTQKVAKAILK
ncbi:alkaline phosphatase family protein [Kaistella jeonii]|uniref:Phosphodiesterase n=1 Tax=Kaistella jeonii TaxID=266749 RepID=A0A0C1D736_9FLAO|nr:ectonucleotide pyrophosphatase/phosphodiesterase [Kaistella jeonii]KIA89690.1 phosphodiesterase [Kaistella jeonii]SFB88344.1 Predicted pyrophosphatase or phosphodiesterase, AlkP superfamily [Kaistella jeonii]VEI95911.1 phosphonoacetate hydrolase [Kaistella jeonii]